METELRKIRNILLFFAIPFALYLMHVLSTVFVPLAFGFFGALLLKPIMRWLREKGFPKYVALTGVLILIFGLSMGVYEVFRLTGNELANVNDQFMEKMGERYDEVIAPVVDFLHINVDNIGSKFIESLKSEKVVERIFGKLTSSISFASELFTEILLSFFFMLLFLAGSIDVEKVMFSLFSRGKKGEAKLAYLTIERVVLKYIAVKTLISLLTGACFSIICSIFGVSFPIFWGVMAFFLNFIQFIGPTISVVALAVFGVVELGFTGSLVLFTLILTGIHVLSGGVVEPILMGKSFSINTITIIVMLLIWGALWGIPGMILSIPITALLKITMERFPSTAVYSKWMG